MIHRWRNWRLPTKLAAVTAIPALLALTLGVLTVHAQVERAAVYQRSDRLVVLGDNVLSLVSALQRERDASAKQLASRPVVDAANLRAERQQVDAALGELRDTAATVSRPGDSVSARLAQADRRIDTLRMLREQVSVTGIDASAAITGYGAVVESLLDVDRALASEIADAALARTATALHDLAVATDQLYKQQDLVAVGIARGFVQPAEQNALRAAYARSKDKIEDFRAAASARQLDDYQRAVADTTVDSRDQQVRRLLDALPLPLAAQFPVTASEWDAASGATIRAHNAVTGSLAGDLRESSRELQASASDRAGVTSVILFGALVLAAVVAIAVARQLLGSLATLRRTVLDVAERQLPATVAAVRDGALPDTGVRPVPVQTTEDIGQLARAFDAVHRQALRLAVEEARLRTGYGGVFVNLARRSQSLVQRQLQLLERLERDEEDPEQLATLFQLDHLATRMRRYNENLMVLSGNDLARRGGEPATVVDVLRAAISEIEHYQRVELRPPPPAQVLGHAAGDLVRLISELLDNATVFSAPDTQVTIAAHRSDNGSLVINVIDHGIGMSDQEIADANAMLRASGQVDLPASRRMGLFVVARLASGHGFDIRLHGGKDLHGVQATVTVPAELVTVVDQPQPAQPPGLPEVRVAAPAAPAPVSPAPIVPAPAPRSAGELPRRTKAASPAVGSGIAAETTSGQSSEPASWPDWWDAGVTAPSADEAGDAQADVGATGETTPIFDQMVSAWFDAPEGRPSSWPAADPDNSYELAAAGSGRGQHREYRAGGAKGSWESAADRGWLAAERVSKSTPASYTDAGLPKRAPKQSLLPGSVAAVADDLDVGPDTPERDATEMRGRLSSLRAGITRGRHSLDTSAQDERAAGE